MKNRGTFALLALFFAGLVGLWAADYAKVPTQRDRERRRSRVLAGLMEVKPDDVRKIEIEGGAEALVFERREGNRWQMTAPLDVAADPSRVESLAYNLKELARKPEADLLEGDAASFGLAPPARTVKVWGAATDAPLATLELGKTSLDRRYVRAGGSSGVEVVDAGPLRLVEIPLVQWRDRELFRVPSFEVDAVSVVGPGVDLKVRRGPDAWRIVAPIKALASEARVEGLVADLGSLRVLDDSRFVAEDVNDAGLDRYGLKTPALTVAVAARRGERRRPTQVLHVGKPVEGKPGQVYARKGDQDDVIALEARVLTGLGKDLDSYRSPKVVDIDPSRVFHFQVKSEGREFDLIRTGQDWYIVHPTAARAERPAVEKFLKALAEVQTGIYLKPEERPDAGLDDPGLVIKLWQMPDRRDPDASASSAEEPAVTLRIGRADAGKRSIYARLEGDRTILALSDTIGASLPRSPLVFRDRQVLAEETDRIDRISFAGGGRKVMLHAPVFRGDPAKNLADGWWMVEPTLGPADVESIGRLLKLLAGLKADGFAADAPKDLVPFGLQDPPLSLTWYSPARSPMLPGPPATARGPAAPEPYKQEERSLLIGASVPNRPGARFAMVAGRPLVFVLGAEAVATLDSEWRDRHVLTFDPALVRRILLAWPLREFNLNPIPGSGSRDWTVNSLVDAPDFHPARAESLVKAASGLTTARFVQYEGPFPARAGLSPPRVAFHFDSDDDKPPKLLRIGNFAGNGLAYATTAPGDEGLVFTVPESLVAGWATMPNRQGELPDNVFAPE